MGDREGLTALRNFVERGDHRIEETEAQFAEVVKSEGSNVLRVRVYH